METTEQIKSTGRETGRRIASTARIIGSTGVEAFRTARARIQDATPNIDITLPTTQQSRRNRMREITDNHRTLTRLGIVTASIAGIPQLRRGALKVATEIQSRATTFITGMDQELRTRANANANAQPPFPDAAQPATGERIPAVATTGAAGATRTPGGPPSADIPARPDMAPPTT